MPVETEAIAPCIRQIRGNVKCQKTKEGNITRIELVSLNGNSLAPESAEWGVLEVLEVPEVVTRRDGDAHWRGRCTRGGGRGSQSSQFLSPQSQSRCRASRRALRRPIPLLHGAVCAKRPEQKGTVLGAASWVSRPGRWSAGSRWAAAEMLWERERDWSDDRVSTAGGIDDK